MHPAIKTLQQAIETITKLQTELVREKLANADLRRDLEIERNNVCDLSSRLRELEPIDAAAILSRGRVTTPTR